MIHPNSKLTLAVNESHDKLIESILQAIHAQNGAISFKDFMELALYHPTWGYYTSGKVRWDSQGDFVTSPEITPFFAKCVARQCQEIFNYLPQADFLEIGAGSGRFAYDFLSELEKLDALPTRYFILEISEALKIRQKNFLSLHAPHFLSRIEWVEGPPQPMTGIIFANEVMDALPFHCFYIKDKVIFERCVSFQNNHFIWCNRQSSPNFKKAIEICFEGSMLPDEYVSEINLTLPAWIQNVVSDLQQGVILLLDYGYGRKTYYHQDRYMGTLMCYYRNQAHANPFLNIGRQDITAHVDFTALIEHADAAAASLLGFTTQSSFLLSCGLLNLLEGQLCTTKEYLFTTQKIKKLILPSQMGEAIKVMALGKNFDAPLLGFHLHDRSRDLLI